MKYSIIYADPPWSYRDKRDTHPRLCGGASVHYPTMDVGAIKNLPVTEIASQNSMLFMWSTFPNLREGLAVIKAWGFDYRTVAFVWIKTNKRQCLQQASFLPCEPDLFFGIGYYTKSNAEICLLGVRGKPHKVSDAVSSVIIAPIGKHSAKPKEARDRIVELCGDIPRIELFARSTAPGWDSWGNEITGVEVFAQKQRKEPARIV